MHHNISIIIVYLAGLFLFGLRRKWRIILRGGKRMPPTDKIYKT